MLCRQFTLRIRRVMQAPRRSAHASAAPPQPQAVNGASERDALKRRPCLPKCYNLASRSDDGKAVKIIRSIGTKYPQFGTLLLNDDNGELVSALEHQHHHNTDCINHAILAKWLEGNGREPRNWATLIAVLSEMGLDLAQDVKDNL